MVVSNQEGPKAMAESRGKVDKARVLNRIEQLHRYVQAADAPRISVAYQLSLVLTGLRIVYGDDNFAAAQIAEGTAELALIRAGTCTQCKTAPAMSDDKWCQTCSDKSDAELRAAGIEPGKPRI